jgi:hypothetical protein
LILLHFDLESAVPHISRFLRDVGGMLIVS